MKKKFVILSLGFALMFSACGNDTKVIEGQVKTISTESAETESEEKEELSKEEVSAGDEQSYKGYAFIYNDVVIEIDAEASPIIDQLGEAVTYFEAPSCAFEGIDKMYGYNSFEVDTYPLEGVDYISTVIFKDDTITTAEGLGIGDSVDKVKEIYGEEGTMENGMLVFEKDERKLCFILKDDAVSSIEYRSTALDE